MRCVALMMVAALAACSKPAPDAAPANDANGSVANVAQPAPVAALPAAVAPAIVPQNTNDPDAFVPLQSAAVKDAIHQALSTGQTQRWIDGKLSGYAVPSQTPGANGCRAVRYTVDQRPSGNYESITACDASR